MPIKKDASGKRWVEMGVVVPGTPEEVWQAMATSSGNAAWFTRATIEERVGGALRFDFGPGASSTGEVTAWEPPHLFGFVERDWSPGAPPVATEITITSRAGGQCVVRMVHSLFTTSDDWDEQMEGFESGWPGFFQVLRIYLRHFVGRKAHSFSVLNPVPGEALPAWTRLTEMLGLSNANVGESRTTAAQPERLSGVIERVLQDDTIRVVIMRLDAPAAGVAMFGTFTTGGQVNVSANVYFYGDKAEDVASASERAWREWFGSAFQAVAR